ncbi:MAG: hypothetical protein ACE5ER_07675 [Nitrospinaceae bacterium]
MSEEKTRFSGTETTVSTNQETSISAFMLKTVGAAMAGAALPALVFYFLF